MTRKKAMAFSPLFIFLALFPASSLRGAQLSVSEALPAKLSSAATATPLSALVAEAKRNNPRILGALRAWQAAEEAPSQARTLPDPEIEIQQFSVGSPRPFAGYSNSNFAYIGF
ncbi:MAG: hypothetical protein KGM47_17705, partial [Acidobacteriota bacterium]|nr:hypothetical protein [Acidobacteriota bacterium]